MSDHQQAACLSIPTGDAIADSIAIKYQLSTGLFQPRNDLEQVRHNSPSSNEFGKGLVCDVDANDIAEYRPKRPRQASETGLRITRLERYAAS